MNASKKTVDILGRRRRCSSIGDWIPKAHDLKTFVHIPGGVKMVCASFVVAVVVWITVQFGAHLNLLNINVLALKAPHGLQSFFGDHAALSGGSNRLPRSIRAIPAQLLDVEEEVLQDSVNFGEGVVSRLGRLEVNLASSDVKVSSGSPVHGQLIDSYPDLKALEQGKHALVAVKASLFLAQNTCQRYGLDDDQCGQFVTSMKLNSTQLGSKCTPQDGPSFSCVLSTKYRSLDGSCNNPSHYSWGKAFTGYRRVIFPHYGDGVQEPRKPVQGRALPSARKVSTSMTQNGSTAHSEMTLAVMQWGQFVEHDLVHTPVSKMISTGNSIICCRQDGSHLSPRYLHPSCFPITIPGNDPVYSKFGLQCMNYVRTVNAMRSDCSFGPAEQMNQATHFLDGSMIYGSTLEQHQKLRSFTNGKMLESRNGKTYLPLTDKPMHYCQLSSNSATCYKSGDIRVNAHPQLTVMHTVWLREHNRVAGELAALNPHWIDSKLFEEARRIVVAQIQHITYNEWLPLVLGDKYTKKMGLKLKKNGFSEDYDENVNPTVTNSFATAAIRFLYSMMEGNIKLFDEHRNHNGSIALNRNYNKPRVVEESGKIDELLRGLATQNGQKSDLEYSSDLLSLLYRDMDRYGMDVVSLDIQRGRDHGLPGYNHFRKLCGLTKVKNFNGFQDVISKVMVQKMQSVYSHPDDVDLIIGGMAERPIDGSLLGPTFRCIVAEQFAKTKRGDKFFYDLARKSGSFTDGQLREIRKTTLGRIFCDNGDNILEMQTNVFQTPSISNDLTSCQNTTVLPRLSLTSWKELPTRSL
uniref:(California timema) hypothetical protein n=1 Tax=Timema californicum TaxID=61474 RepID=A0A7R9JA05_TIMCA|nr:unnamed protein product [Timema californicum]